MAPGIIFKQPCTAITIAEIYKRFGKSKMSPCSGGRSHIDVLICLVLFGFGSVSD